MPGGASIFLGIFTEYRWMPGVDSVDVRRLL